MSISGKRAAIIKGTLILTFTGVLNRAIGFFYRIFLSGQIGAEGMGIYQLIFPVIAICHALTMGGINVAISKLCAEKEAVHDHSGSLRVLMGGLCLTVGLSIMVGTLLLLSAPWIAVNIYQEEQLTLLFQIVSFSLPFSSIHTCITSYYYGKKQTVIPALSQLLEQLVRVGSCMAIARILSFQGKPVDISIAVISMVCGEIVSVLFCLTALCWNRRPQSTTFGSLHIFPLLKLSLPLGCNHFALHILQSIEAFLLPTMLTASGLTRSDALSVYGILTGMSLPFLLFPSTITNAIATLLLPAISEAKATNNTKLLRGLIARTFTLSVSFGIFLTLFFFVFGPFCGSFFFHNELAGDFIRTLSFLCPFLCLVITLESILNGLGKTFSSFLHNLAGLLLRILFVVFAIPVVGITGYLWGILACEILISLLHSLSLLHNRHKLSSCENHS